MLKMLAYIASIVPHNVLNYSNTNILLGRDMIKIYNHLIFHNESRIPEFVRLVMVSNTNCIHLIHISHIAKYGPVKVSEFAGFMALTYATSHYTVSESTLDVVRRYSHISNELTRKLGYYHILGGQISEDITYSDLVNKGITSDEIKYLAEHMDMSSIVNQMLNSQHGPERVETNRHIVSSVNWKSVQDIERYIMFCLYYKFDISLKRIYKDITLTPGLVCVALQHSIKISEYGIVVKEYNATDIFMLRSITNKSARDEAYKLLPLYVKADMNTQRLFR